MRDRAIFETDVWLWPSQRGGREPAPRQYRLSRRTSSPSPARATRPGSCPWGRLLCRQSGNIWKKAARSLLPEAVEDGDAGAHGSVPLSEGKSAGDFGYPAPHYKIREEGCGGDENLVPRLQALFRDPSAGRRRGSEGGPGTAGPRVDIDHPALHTRERRPSAAGI